MKNLKTQFTDMKKQIPKNVQWLLLAAAFIIVLILLTLLLRGDKKPKADTNAANAVITVLKVDPDSLDWSGTNVGETKKQLFTVSASGPVKIDDVRISKEVAGLSKKPKTTCTNIGQVSDKVSCTVTLEYAPTSKMDVTAVSMFIDWRGWGQPEKMNKSEKIAIAIGAKVFEEPKIEPVIEEPELIVEPKQTIKEEIESLAANDVFDPFEFEPEEVIPEPVVKAEPVKTTSRPTSNTPSEACSDFAFPGYGMAGQQIGWIKPERGGYNFYPFADKTCTKPTGVYNPDNGIITDIKDPSKKIGTDAEHIGFGVASGGVIPKLSNPVAGKQVNKARQLSAQELVPAGRSAKVFSAPPPETIMTSSGSTVTSSAPYDRTFILRQYKPIPATIVSEVRADPKTLHERGLPVRATVDRNVYSDNGRTIIVPAGTLLLGYATGEMPGPYKTIGRMEIEWYQFIRPDGVEFNFAGENPFSGDSQGRVGVPGHGSSDYMEQFVMPMLTAIVPAAVNMIAPISDKFVNQIDLDNNTVTQTGQVRSSELAKNEIITTWNKVAQKLMVDMMDNTVPPFSIAAGTRITVFSPVDLMVTCGSPEDGNGKKCAIAPYNNAPRITKSHNAQPNYNDGSWVGQVRSFDLEQHCNRDGTVSSSPATISAAGLDYRTVLFYCQSIQYKAINNAKQEAVYQNQQQKSLTNAEGNKLMQNPGQYTQEYNEQVLGLKYNEGGTIKSPFDKEPAAPVAPVITCEDGNVPDTDGCCVGETYTDMGDQGFNCCPDTGGDCFPPIK